MGDEYVTRDPWLNDVAVSAVTGLVLTLPVVAARVATPSGVLAGAFFTAWMSYQGGAPTLVAFACLVVFGSLSSRAGRARKEVLGVAQEGGGRRAFKHVLANAGPAATALFFGLLFPQFHDASVAAACGALAGTLSDTVSGEIGMLVSSPPRLLLIGPIVRRGTDGGMTYVGVMAGVVTAALVALAVTPWNLRWVSVFAAGVMGTLSDSVLGATIERRRLIGNEGVNFVSGALAAATAWSLES